MYARNRNDSQTISQALSQSKGWLLIMSRTHEEAFIYGVNPNLDPYRTRNPNYGKDKRRIKIFWIKNNPEYPEYS